MPTQVRESEKWVCDLVIDSISIETLAQAFSSNVILMNEYHAVIGDIATIGMLKSSCTLRFSQSAVLFMLTEWKRRTCRGR